MYKKYGRTLSDIKLTMDFMEASRETTRILKEDQYLGGREVRCTKNKGGPVSSGKKRRLNVPVSWEEGRRVKSIMYIDYAYSSQGGIVSWGKVED